MAAKSGLVAATAIIKAVDVLMIAIPACLRVSRVRRQISFAQAEWLGSSGGGERYVQPRSLLRIYRTRAMGHNTP